MIYDEQLAQRVRQELTTRDGIKEQKMFGGMAFMLHGNMSVGVDKDQLMVRCGPDCRQEDLAKPHARPMDFTGRPVKGCVYVQLAGITTDVDLQEWVQLGRDLALSLPRK